MTDIPDPDNTPDQRSEFDPLTAPPPTRDPRGKARLKQSLPKRKPGRPKKGQEPIQGGYQTIWAPQKRADGSPGPQYALLACPFKEIFFGGARGGGKALPLDEQIVTPTGYRRMGEMSIGDEVHGPGGTVARVIGVYPQGVEPVFRITLVDGRTVRASRGHLWRMRVGGEELTVTTDYVRTLFDARLEVSLPVEDLNQWVAIGSIKYVGLAETQCIKIDSDDGLFLTNDEIVTHNTDGAIGVWLEHAARHGQHAKGLFLRRQYANLKDVLDRMSQLFPRVGATFNKGEGTWLFPNGANLKLGHLWDEAATNAYQGHQYSIIFIEEVTHWGTPNPIDMMRATLRSAAGVPTKLVLTGNPGGAGHQWVRERYVSPAPAGYAPITDTKTGATRIYIPSRVTDNLLLMQNDPNYITNLKQSGSETLVRAWLEGDWNIVAGGFFSDILNPERHFVPPFEIPDTWRYRRSFDWGSAAPASLCIWAISDGNPIDHSDPQWDGFVFPRGSLILVKEWYTIATKEDGTLQPNQGQRLTNLALGNGIAQRSLRYNFSGCVADPSIFAKPGRESIYDEMKKGAQEAGHNLILSPADNNRVAGWQRMRDMLEAAAKPVPEKPGLWVFNTCKHWIRTVPVLQRDETHPDDLDTSQEDHCLSGDTLVETTLGNIAIRDLVGTIGYVRQADGSWRAYNDCRRTRIATNTIRVVTSDGRSVVCTPDHLILTNDGWIEAKHTLGKTIVCVDDRMAHISTHQEDPHDRYSHQPDDSGIQRGAILPMRQVLSEEGAPSACGGLGVPQWSGSRWLSCASQGREQSQQPVEQSGSPAGCGASFVAYESARAGGEVEARYREGEGGVEGLAWFGRWPGMAFQALARVPGTSPGRTGESYLSTVRQRIPNSSTLGEKLKVLLEQLQIRQPTRAWFGQRAARLCRVWMQIQRQQVCQDQNLRQAMCPVDEVSAEVVHIEDAADQDVYNLEVEDTHAFAVNGGLIVHNCADSTRYACQTGVRSMIVGDLSGR